MGEIAQFASSAFEAIDALLAEVGVTHRTGDKVISLLMQALPLGEADDAIAAPMREVVNALQNDPATAEDQLQQLADIDERLKRDASE